MKTEFEVVWSPGALEKLVELDRTVARRIVEKVGNLRVNPERWLRRLVGSPYYRLRVGDYRLIIEMEGTEMRNLGLDFGHRRSVYDR